MYRLGVVLIILLTLSMIDHPQEKVEQIEKHIDKEEDTGEEEELDCTEVDDTSNQAVSNITSKLVQNVEKDLDVLKLSGYNVEKRTE